MQLNGDHLIRLLAEPSRESCIDGFWRWVAILADGDYERAIEALYWPGGTTWTADELKARVTTFFGGSDAWSVVIPNSRLVGVINDALDFPVGSGWFMAQIPLTTEPADPKCDTIPLMGLAVSFFIRPLEDCNVLEFEIFHV